MSERMEVEIELGKHSGDCRVVIDGHDVTDCLRAVEVRAEVAHVTLARIEVMPTKVRLRGDADVETLLLERLAFGTVEKGE